ncbi:MAG: STAS domain-containing protein [Micrococcales bacterium]|nr:STAS domain-containing protein [Micrococcales bacterium]
MTELKDRTMSGAILVSHRHAETRVCLVGAIDSALRQQASDSMGLALMGGTPVVLDASGATFVDSSGVAFVIQLARAMQEAGVDLSLYDPERVLLSTLALVGLAGLVKVAPPDTAAAGA